MDSMSEDTKNTLLAIYNRLAAKIKITGLTATVESDPDSYPGINIETTDDRLYIMLYIHTGSDAPTFHDYRWEYMDCITGAIIESELNYLATDEEVVAFFKHTLETDESVMKL